MPQLLPMIPGDGSYEFSTQLNGVSYRIGVRWNARDSAWYLDFYDAQGAPIVNGLKVVLGTHIGRRVAHPLFRDGVLVARDLSGQGKPPGFYDLGARVALLYFTAFEVAAVIRG